MKTTAFTLTCAFIASFALAQTGTRETTVTTTTQTVATLDSTHVMAVNGPKTEAAVPPTGAQ